MASQEAISAESFSEKYDRYAQMVYRLCILRLGNAADAEDAMQNVFIRLCYKAPQFPDLREERAWLIRVTVNVCKDFQRLFWRRNVVALEQPEELAQPDHSEQGQEMRLIDLYRLSPKQRTVLQLYYYEGYSAREIGEILHLKEQSVTSQLCRARKKLKLELEEGDLYEPERI